MTPPPVPTRHVLRRIAPLQLGKVLAILYGILGLLFIPFALIMSLVASHVPAEQRVGMFAFGAGFALFMPVMYALMGFLTGVIGAWLYNLVARWIGGVEIELE